MKSYATRLGLLYPLGSPIDLDQEFDPFLPSRYRDTGEEGRWYVAGWRGRDGLNLNRDQGEALCGEWVLCAPLQRVLGTPEWERVQEMDRVRGLRREVGGAGVVLEGYTRPGKGEIPTPGEIVAYLERESWGSGEYEDYIPGLHLGNERRENPMAGILRHEWALSPYSIPSSSPYFRLVQAWSARRRGDWGQRDAVLWVRYIRRGVREPWEIFDIVRDEDQALKQIDHTAIPLSPRLELLRQVYREEWDQDQIKKEQEEREKREARERWEKHERSEACFRRMWEGKDQEGRELARKWSATMMYMKERRDIVARLEVAQDFRELYQRVMDAEKVAVKKKAVREVLRWLRMKEGVNVEVPPTE